MIRPHPTTRRPATMLRRAAVSAFALTLLVAGVTAAPATAAPGGKATATGSFVDSTPVPGGFASWAELLRVQQRMNTAAARITTVAQRSADSGFAGVVADPTTRQLQVYWKGEPPAHLVATARATVATRCCPPVLPAGTPRRGRPAAGHGRRRDHHGRARADGAGLLVGTQDGLLGATARRRSGDRADRGRRLARHPVG
ncbi:hypothetical protein NKG94_18135 [Micromonospora sp. M12]